MFGTRFAVEGFGYFPIDMLRYDACFPADESKGSYEITNEGMTREKRRVELMTYHPLKAVNGLTEDRWASFGWHIVEVREPGKF